MKRIYSANPAVPSPTEAQNDAHAKKCPVVKLSKGIGVCGKSELR